MTRVQPAERPAPHGVPRAAIRTKALGKTYADGSTAVQRLDLEVPAGMIFGLLGPNGAGKTTTIGMLTTRVVPTSGTAAVNGTDVVARPARAKRQIGVVPQVNTLDRSLDVRENLYYHGRYFGMGRAESEARSDELLDRFRLREKAARKTETLSGGMAQRLMVARALMHRPAVLFLDEPTTGLDPQSRIALWDMLGELHAEGQTILLTTHYMEEADQLCERLAIMDNGRVLAEGTPTELKAQVDADAMVGIVADGDLATLEALSRRLADIDGVTRTDVRGGMVRVFARAARPLLPPLLARAQEDGVVVSDVHVTEPTLESVFIALTGRELRD